MNAPNEITVHECSLARSSWDMILNHTAPVFVQLRDQPDFPFGNCMIYFTHIFYKRLFDIHPFAKGMFKNVQSQGRALVQILTIALTSTEDRVLYDQILTQLAHVHNKKGVKAAEYGIVGEVLFWSLRKCLGEEVYNTTLHRIWIKLFSQMLSIIIPIAVQYEVTDGRGQERRFIIKNIPLSEQENLAILRTEEFGHGEDNARRSRSVDMGNTHRIH